MSSFNGFCVHSTQLLALLLHSSTHCLHMHSVYAMQQQCTAHHIMYNAFPYLFLCTAYNVLCTQLVHIQKVYSQSLDNQIHSIRLSAMLSILNKLIFPFHSIWIHTLAGWLADRSKVCSFWIDPLWYQSAKRSVHLCAKSSSSSPSSSFDCVFKNRHQTGQNENWFYFQHITSHFVFKVYIRLRMLTRLNHAKSFHTTSRDWKCKKLWILNLYWHLCRGSFYFILLFYDVLYTLHSLRVMRCHWVAFYTLQFLFVH